jgi:hypothetical protein
MQGTSSKKLYSFIKSKKCDGSGVAPLKKDGKTYTDASEKAELLNEQFPVFFVVCVSCFPIGPFLSAGQPTSVSVNPWLIEPSGCHF